MADQQDAESIMARLAGAWGMQLGCEFDRVKMDARLTADLRFDDLDHLDALMAAENEFDLVIEDADAEQCVTVADYVALVQRLMKTPAYAGFEPALPHAAP